jgi:hypothetical protein
MKHIKQFNRFVLNENQVSYDQAAVDLLRVMKNDPKSAITIYTSLKKQYPELFQTLRSVAEMEGTNLESILDGAFQKDPTLLHLLDSDPETKAGVLQRTKLEDFSRLGRLSKMDLF